MYEKLKQYEISQHRNILQITLTTQFAYLHEKFDLFSGRIFMYNLIKLKTMIQLI